MTTTSEAFEVMGMVAACHPRTAPRLDDEEAAMAIASVWAELFSVHNLDVADLKAAVVKRSAEGADSAPEPAEIIKVAREIRRERAERETREQLDAREAERDARLGLPSPPPKPIDFKPPQRPAPIPGLRPDGTLNPLSIRCPHCHAGEFRKCKIPGTTQELKLIPAHPSRIDAAEAAAKTARGEQ